MYLEEAEVKEYTRKNGTKYKQLHLGTKSRFKKEQKVNIIDAEDLKDFIAKANPEYIENIEATNESLASEVANLKKELQAVKEDVEEKDSNLEVAKTNIFKLQEEKENLTKDLLAEKETSKKLLASITKLTNENKELEKENIFLKSRSLFNRILNKQYKKEDVPEIVEAEVNSNSEE